MTALGTGIVLSLLATNEFWAVQFVVQGGDADDFWIAVGALVTFALLAVGLATAVVRWAG